MFTRRARTRLAAVRVTAAPVAVLTAFLALAVAACGTNAAGTTAGTGRSASAGPASSPPPSPVSVPSASVPSRQRAPGPPAPGTDPIGPARTECTGWPAAPAGTLPASFAPTSALRCVTGYTAVPGKGTWLAAILEKATGNLTPLADALRAVSGHGQPGVMCPQFVMVPPAIVLTAADGTMIRPRFPVTDCGDIQHQVFTALAALKWQTVSQHLLQKAPTPANP